MFLPEQGQCPSFNLLISVTWLSCCKWQILGSTYSSIHTWQWGINKWFLVWGVSHLYESLLSVRGNNLVELLEIIFEFPVLFCNIQVMTKFSYTHTHAHTNTHIYAKVSATFEIKEWLWFCYFLPPFFLSFLPFSFSLPLNIYWIPIEYQLLC